MENEISDDCNIYDCELRPPIKIRSSIDPNAKDIPAQPNYATIPIGILQGTYPYVYYCSTLAQIYKCPPPSPTNKSVIGVISLGGGLYGNVDANGILTNGDCQAYWSSQGIPTSNHPTVVLVNLLGASNNPYFSQFISSVNGINRIMTYGDATLENSLDVQTIGSWYPSSNLTIIVYFSPNTLGQYLTAIQSSINTYINVRGVNVKPQTISVSWGANESNIYSSYTNALNTIYSNAASQGINICIATGDNDSTGKDYTGNNVPSLNVNVLGSSPWCIACGGTTLKSLNNIYDINTSETVWNDSNTGNDTGTGGGVSVYLTKATYQANVAKTYTNRCIPDISLNSDGETGMVYIVSSLYTISGGTSTAAPAIAAFIAITGINYFYNSKLYKLNSNCFHDITVGNNRPFSYPLLGYDAEVGYDLCTGFGSIIGTTMSTAMNTYVPTSNIQFTNILSNFGYFSTVKVPFYSTLSNTKWYDSSGNLTIPPTTNIPFSFFKNKMCRF